MLELVWQDDSNRRAKADRVALLLGREEVGYCRVEHHNGYIWIDGLFVYQGHNSKGYGRKLLREVFRKFGNVEYRMWPEATPYQYEEEPPLAQELLEEFYASEGFSYSHWDADLGDVWVRPRKKILGLL